MRKMIVAFAIALFVAGCDSERNPISSDTLREKVVLYDTVTNKKDTNIILGSFAPKDGSPISGIIVCSDKIGRCAKSNSKGVFRIAKSQNSIVAGRYMSVVDTTPTPENALLSLPNDTVIDTISVGDTTKIVVTINLPDTVGVEDTLTYVNNGTILSEVPIESWGFILPPNYIVQRNISAIDSTWDGCIKTVEAVYFLRGDSVAKVVTLGKVGKDFSGFVYTLYNDSSYRTDDKIYNLFIRGKNDSGTVVVKTNVYTFSERFGDIPTEILNTKVGVREYEIVPKFIPAAKNNEKLKESEKKFVQQIDSVDWIGSDALNIKFDIRRFGIYLVSENKFDSLGIDSMSFDIDTKADSIIIPVPGWEGTRTIPNTRRNYGINLVGTFHSFKIDSFDGVTPAVISNIRFYYKKK